MARRSLPKLAVLLALAPLASAASAQAADAPRCAAQPTQAPAPEIEAEVLRRSAALAAARLAGDAAGRLAHYAPDSVTMADYQPRLFGPAEALRYFERLAGTRALARYDQRPEQLISLGPDDVIERGTFALAFVPAAGSGAEPALPGRYVHLWRRQADGSFKLKAEVWGYAQAIADPAAHTLGGLPQPGAATNENAPALAAELAALNAAETEFVRSHDTARIDSYALDATFIPFAETPKEGLDQIRAHLAPYIANGRGATFDPVRIWNEGHEARGAYVIEYPKFEVTWRAGEAGGTVSGSGLRLWRREPDCRLKRVLEIGTHDHR